jgi:hypothetical protein
MKALIKELFQISDAIDKASRWRGTDKSLSKIGLNGSEKNDYIFEMYSTFRLLRDLATHYEIEVVKSTLHGYSFPQKPGKPINWPYFLIVHKSTGKKNNIFLGVTIKNEKIDFTHHPDIFFTKEMKPNFEDILNDDCILLLDCKHSKKGKIKMYTYYDFTGMVKTLDLSRKIVHDLEFVEFKDLIGHSVITNGEVATTNVEIHKIHNVMEVGDLDIGKKAIFVGFG